MSGLGAVDSQANDTKRTPGRRGALPACPALGVPVVGVRSEGVCVPVMCKLTVGMLTTPPRAPGVGTAEQAEPRVPVL